MIFRNNNKITNIYRGTLPISNVYRGVNLVYTGAGEKTYDYLTFTALEPSTIRYSNSDIATTQYSYDKVNWETADNKTLNLENGDKVYFKGEITGEPDGMMMGANFTMTGKIEASGSIMSLQVGNPNDKTINYKNEFNGLFRDCSSLVTAPELPATTLTEECYSYMFQGCGLTTAPELPATTLADSCYYGMFSSCKLTTAPELPAKKLANSCYNNMFSWSSHLTTAPTILPATELASGCYNSMFNGCSNLTTAPELPATTLAISCYQSMFNSCSSLTTAPELPATTLPNFCYSNMFNGCSNLNYIKALFTSQGLRCTEDWVKGVASSGTFVKNKDATWNVTGVDGIPEGWTVETA